MWKSGLLVVCGLLAGGCVGYLIGAHSCPHHELVRFDNEGSLFLNSPPSPIPVRILAPFPDWFAPDRHVTIGGPEEEAITQVSHSRNEKREIESIGVSVGGRDPSTDFWCLVKDRDGDGHMESCALNMPSKGERGIVYLDRDGDGFFENMNMFVSGTRTHFVFVDMGYHEVLDTSDEGIFRIHIDGHDRSVQLVDGKWTEVSKEATAEGSAG